MFRNLRIWFSGWRQDYKGWWVRARRQGDSEDILRHLEIEGFLEESCIAIKDKKFLLKVDDISGGNEAEFTLYSEAEFTLYSEAEFASKRVNRAGDRQDRLSPRFRGSFWRHSKRQSEYVSMGVGSFQGSYPDHVGLDQLPVMIYISLEGSIYVRPMDEFLDGRFVCINGDPIVKYGLVGAADYAENSSAKDGGSPATPESPTQEPGKEIPPESL